MYIIKVLKRRDAASIVVAIWLAFALTQLTSMPVHKLASIISDIGNSASNEMFHGPTTGWRNEYLNPVVSFILQILVLEILIRLFVWVHPFLVRKKK